MELLCNTSLSSPCFQKHTDISQRASFRNQPFIPKRAGFHNQPKHNNVHTLHQKTLPTISSEQSYPSSLFRGNKMICQSSERPAWLNKTVPEKLRPYVMLARLDRDIGFWLPAWPTFWYN